MSKPSFVYVTYIATTPEKVWKAIVDPSLARQYWNDPNAGANHPAHVNVSDWKKGSKWEHQRVDNNNVDIAGEVVETDPPRRLVLTWARPKELGDKSKHSRVTFDIEPQGKVVRLTVTHEDLEKDAPMLAGISDGWPKVLANLKTFLETGRPL